MKRAVLEASAQLNTGQCQRKGSERVQEAKDQVTLLACTNAMGSIKFPLVFIHKSVNPRCFKTWIRMIFPLITVPKKVRGWICTFSQNGFMPNLSHAVGGR